MAAQPNERLDSWKEIAAYLKRDERTAMRWAKERGLPVHRLPGPGRSAVFAYAHEVDAWLAGQSPAALANGVTEVLRPAVSSPTARRPTDGAAVVGEARPAAATSLRARRLSTLTIAAVVAGAAAVLGLLALLASGWGRPGAPSRASFEGNRLRAWDSKGRLAWEYQFPGSLRVLNSTLLPPRPDWQTRVVDLDGDGGPETLAVVAFAQPGRPDDFREELYCFSSDGKVLWHYEPKMVLRFAERQFDGSWAIQDLLVSPEGKTRSVWLAVNHTPWWPSFIVKLDAAGHAAVQFVNSGSLFSLNYVKTATGSYMLAGGVNNEPHAGILAVLKEGQAFASSPQSSGSRYECLDCPEGKPWRYYLFPRSEVNLLVGKTHNGVDNVTVGHNKIQVFTCEDTCQDRGIYDLTGDFEVEAVSVFFSDSYWPVHEKLEKEGKIKHPAEKCPERFHPKPVREWRDGAWRTLQPSSELARR